MPRPLFRVPENKTETQTQTHSNLSAAPPRTRQLSPLQQMEVERLLRKQRSKAYLDAVSRLDAGGHVHNREAVDQLLDAIRAEFPEVELHGVLLGIVSACYLGKPYEVHSVDMLGGIITHYRAGEPMPDGLEKARGIAIHGGYAFIEVYTDCCRAVDGFGNVSVIR